MPSESLETVEKRTVIPRGRRVRDEIWAPAEVRAQAAWNQKTRWTLADLLPDAALPPQAEGSFEILVRYRESDASFAQRRRGHLMAVQGRRYGLGAASDSESGDDRQAGRPEFDKRRWIDDEPQRKGHWRTRGEYEAEAKRSPDATTLDESVLP